MKDNRGLDFIPIQQGQIIYDGWMKISRVYHNDKPYEKLHVFSASGIVPYNRAYEKVCLVQQFRPALGRYTWEIPAGCLDIIGESFEEVAKRELIEETAMNEEYIGKIVPLAHPYNMMVGATDAMMSLYVIEIGHGYTLKPEDYYTNTFKPNEEIEAVKWVNMAEWKLMIEYGQITDSKTIMAFMHMTNKLQEINNILK